MIGLFFEVLPKAGREETYFEMARLLRPELDKHDGLVFIDRYRSLSTGGLILSHQLWSSEECLIRWRENTKHKTVQRAGREQHFADYRLRVARLIREWTSQGEMAGTAAIDPALEDRGRQILAIARKSAPMSSEGVEAFESVYRESEYLTVRDNAGRENTGQFAALAARDPSITAIRLFSVIRDYGMYNRMEAPQAYPPVEKRI